MHMEQAYRYLKKKKPQTFENLKEWFLIIWSKRLSLLKATLQ